MDLKVEACRDVAGVVALADEWQLLHDEAGDVNPFSGPDWAVPWLERHARGSGRYEPYVLAVRDEHRLVGVAPLCRQAIMGARVLQPVGTGHPWIGPFELPSFSALPDVGRGVARAVIRYLCQRFADWDWVSVLLGPTAPWFEPQWLPGWEFTILERGMKAAVVLELQPDVDVYAGRRNLKESFRRARNRLTREFGEDGWRVRRVQKDTDLVESLDRLVRLHGERAELREGQPVHVDVFAVPSVREYLATVVERMGRRGAVSVYELLIGSDVVASQLVLQTASASYSSVSGMAPVAWSYSAITYLQSRAVADAQEEGRRRFNLSQGPNQAKLRWTETVEIYPEFLLLGPRTRSKLLYLAAQARGAGAVYLQARGAHRV